MATIATTATTNTTTTTNQPPPPLCARLNFKYIRRFLILGWGSLEVYNCFLLACLGARGQTGKCLPRFCAEHYTLRDEVKCAN